MIVTGVPSLADVSTTASQIAYHGATSSWYPRKRQERASPRSCARCSSRSRSSPSPTRRRRASTPRSLTPASMVRRSSVRFTAVIRPNQPTTNFPAGIPSLRRTSTGSPSKRTRGSSSIPSRTTENFSRGATCSPTSSSRISGLTAINRSVKRARIVSIARNTSVPVVPK